MLEKLVKKFRRNLLFNSFLGAIVVLALFVRIYRIDQLLGFYYDQGRDAVVIWEFWKHGKFFLIGPTTGIEGVFRGPWYYWLITPFYILGKGNPVWPSVFLSITTVIAIFLSYKIAEQVAGKWAGILAAIIGGFSLNLVYASRWLSNPTPMLLISMIFVYSLFWILDGKKWAWILTAFMAGMAMQFGSAAEVFYFLAIAVFAVYLFFADRKKLPDLKTIVISIVVLAATFAPQVIFDFRHQGILRGNVSKFLLQEGSFKLSFWEIAKIRFPFYYDVLFSKLFHSLLKVREVFAVIFAALFLYKIKSILNNKKLLLLLIVLLSPIVGMLFFQGNYGNVYDYYFTGYYLIFVIFFASVLGLFSKSIWGKLIIIVFVFFFLKDNLPVVRNYIVSGVDRPTTIALGNEKQAIDWIYKDSSGKDFNIDVYVPPVIPYAYDYLFKWYGGSIHGREPINKLIPLLYTIYEVDPPHPERLEAWLTRQKTIGKVLEEQRFGGVVVQRRERL
ncbi:glycosyltransferase family 39 protein [Patescibacteria group bacterium]|nr:glycosyltransferase family 39 protein [Patescibacteria group bacterium]